MLTADFLDLHVFQLSQMFNLILKTLILKLKSLDFAFGFNLEWLDGKVS